ncbi:hypothetical protein [Enterobacter cloacae]
MDKYDHCKAEERFSLTCWMSIRLIEKHAIKNTQIVFQIKDTFSGTTLVIQRYKQDALMLNLERYCAIPTARVVLPIPPFCSATVMTPIIKPPPIRFLGMGIIARSIHGRSISPDAYGVNIDTIKDAPFYYRPLRRKLKQKFHIRNAPIARMV